MFNLLARKGIEMYVLFGTLIFFIFLALVPFIGVEVKGSIRWIDLPVIPRFQPIELVKPFFILFIAKTIILDKKLNIYKCYFIFFKYI